MILNKKHAICGLVAGEVVIVLSIIFLVITILYSAIKDKSEKMNKEASRPAILEKGADTKLDILMQERDNCKVKRLFEGDGVTIYSYDAGYGIRYLAISTNGHVSISP